MAIGRKTIENILKSDNFKWKTSITKVEPNKIITRGHSQEELIGNITFSEMVYLLVKGEIPSKKDSKMLETVLVSFCDHSVTPPSTQTARLIASTGSPLHVCVGGGLLAFGKHHAGAIENVMHMLQDGVKRNDGNMEKTAHDLVNEFKECGEKIPGFGHRYHEEDPRVPKIIETAEKMDCIGIHTKLALTIQSILFEEKRIMMNIDGVNGAILSDMGFDWGVGTGIFMIGRLPAIISHVYEEKNREHPFRKLFNVEDIYYDGESDNRMTEQNSK